ncbi:hypothetical protein M422DRAFT_23123 [Sphaerobolus stellatus SS14]|nr:hypothetical protein M422DRAFT_23123 [Sphaerobolus stellatus SS14]
MPASFSKSPGGYVRLTTSSTLPPSSQYSHSIKDTSNSVFHIPFSPIPSQNEIIVNGEEFSYSGEDANLVLLPNATVNTEISKLVYKALKIHIEVLKQISVEFASFYPSLVDADADAAVFYHEGLPIVRVDATAEELTILLNSIIKPNISDSIIPRNERDLSFLNSLLTLSTRFGAGLVTRKLTRGLARGLIILNENASYFVPHRSTDERRYGPISAFAPLIEPCRLIRIICDNDLTALYSAAFFYLYRVEQVLKLPTNVLPLHVKPDFSLLSPTELAFYRRGEKILDSASSDCWAELVEDIRKYHRWNCRLPTRAKKNECFEALYKHMQLSQERNVHFPSGEIAYPPAEIRGPRSKRKGICQNCEGIFRTQLRRAGEIFGREDIRKAFRYSMMREPPKERSIGKVEGYVLSVLHTMKNSWAARRKRNLSDRIIRDEKELGGDGKEDFEASFSPLKDFMAEQKLAARKQGVAVESLVARNLLGKNQFDDVFLSTVKVT